MLGKGNARLTHPEAAQQQAKARGDDASGNTVGPPGGPGYRLPRGRSPFLLCQNFRRLLSGLVFDLFQYLLGGFRRAVFTQKVNRQKPGLFQGGSEFCLSLFGAQHGFNLSRMICLACSHVSNLAFCSLQHKMKYQPQSHMEFSIFCLSFFRARFFRILTLDRLISNISAISARGMWL